MEKTILKKLTDTLCVLALLVAAGWFAAGFFAPELPPFAQATAAPPADVTVVLDAGHGGTDGGAVGLSGTVEAGLNLAVAKLVQANLEAEGINVVMTRSSEDALAPDKQGDMQERKRIMNNSGGNLLVSIHMNKFPDRSVQGSMVYFMQGSAEGERLAQCLVDAVCDCTGQRRRLANPGDYFVIRESPLPSAIVECGFLSNAEDEARLNDPAYQKLLAEGIAAGVLAYVAGPSPSAQPAALLPTR